MPMGILEEKSSSIYWRVLCRDLQAVLERGIKSIAVVLKHSAIFPDHEKAVGEIAKELGFEQVLPKREPSL